MTNLTLMLIGMGVFSLLLTGLALSAYEFLNTAERPDLKKGAELRTEATGTASQT